eukprot:1883753-Rhodomonas_salina.1
MQAVSPVPRCWVKNKLPMYQFTVIGEEGAGKSTTLRWLAHHLQLPISISDRFLSSKGQKSYTRQFTAAQITDGLKVFDTKGLPSLEEKYARNIKQLLLGYCQEHSEVQWDYDPGDTQVWSSLTRTSPDSAEVEAPCQPFSKPSPLSASHATLFIVPYIDVDKDTNSTKMNRVVTMLSALRNQLIEPVIGVSSIGNCLGKEVRNAKVFAKAIGYTARRTFPLCSMQSDDKSNEEIYLPP